MAYVFHGPPARGIRLPPRPWNSRGMGDLNSWWCTVFSTAAQRSNPTGWCAQYLPAAPALPAGSTSPGVPVGYSDQTLTGAVPDNTSGATTVPVPYSPVYSEVPTSECDWTAANPLDVTTWCAGDWAIALGLVVGAVLVMKGLGGRR